MVTQDANTVKPRSKPATKAEKARYAKLKEMGCIINRARLWPVNFPCSGLPVQIQHLTAGGRRLGNEFTIPLCNWHHMATLPAGLTTSQATLRYGPSFAKSRKQFEETFGSEEFLLAETNRLLEGM